MTVSRPTQGGSPGTWGTQLDAYLDQFVDSSGVLVPAAVRTALGGSLSFVQSYGAKCDGRRLTGDMANGSTTFTASSGTFTSADVGKVVAVADNSGSGVVMAFTGTVSALISSTQVTLSATAPHALTAVALDIATDDTVAIQAAIDAANTAGGGKVVTPDADILVSSLTLKQGVTLTSLSGNQGYASQRAGGARLRSVTTSAVIVDTPVGTTYAPGIIGFQLDGHGVASIGVKMRAPQWGVSKALSFTNFTDQALQVAGGNAHTVEDVVAVNCLLTRSRVAKAGVVEIAGADHHVSRVEANASLTAITDANLYCCGILISQTNGFHSHLIGEISDVGIRVTGARNRFANCRADMNWGHGWEIAPGTIAPCNGTYVSCHAVNNGRNTANTYDGFSISGTGNSFAACRSVYTTGSHRYGFNDTVSTSLIAQRNTYDEGCGGDGATAPFKSITYVGSGRTMPPHDMHPADAATSWDVTGTSLMIPDLYTGAATVTDFTGGVQGQTVKVLGNAFVTIAHNAGSAGSTIKTNTGANKVLVAAKMYTFTLFNGTWYEAAGDTQDVQIYTGTGASTWTKPVGAKSVEVFLISGGGGGGAGRRGAAGTVRCGGGGGGGGSKSYGVFRASDLGATETVTVGAGGGGAIAQAADSADGANGTDGADTTFGSWLRAGKGKAGAGGTATSGAAGTINGGTFPGTNGGAASTTGAVGVGTSSSTGGGTGGGSGGGVTSADATSAGGAGIDSYDRVGWTVNAGGTTPGGVGASAANRTANTASGGGGGGGGASSITGAAGAGGDGGLYGGAGGGGGASLNGNASGAGGAGKNGIAIVISRFE